MHAGAAEHNHSNLVAIDEQSTKGEIVLAQNIHHVDTCKGTGNYTAVATVGISSGYGEGHSAGSVKEWTTPPQNGYDFLHAPSAGFPLPGTVKFGCRFYIA
eukprot:scaffold178256_cov22-Tisochrysis_lutea.AAC.1